MKSYKKKLCSKSKLLMFSVLILFFFTEHLFGSDFRISKIISRRNIKKRESEKKIKENIKEINFSDIVNKKLENGDFEKSKYREKLEKLIEKNSKRLNLRKCIKEYGKKNSKKYRIKILSKKNFFKVYRYYKLILPSWKNGRYVYIAFHKLAINNRYHKLLIYHHGMHARDYHRTFGVEMNKSATNKVKKELIFVGIVDIPPGRGNWKNRWEEYDKKMGRGPELIFNIVDEVKFAVKKILPETEKMDVILAGHSGGHRVLDNVSRMMLANPDSLKVKKLRKELIGIYHFDVWYSNVVVKYIPKFLKEFPEIRLFASLCHNEPVIHGRKIIKILKMKKRGNYYTTTDGHLKIRFARSHWGAFRDMFIWAVRNCK